MRKYSNCYKAEKGKHFVLTERGKQYASFRNYEVGKPLPDEDDTYAIDTLVEDGALIEVDDPDFVTLPGYKVVYEHNGYELCVGNPIVFFDREMAERYMKGYKRKYKWHTEDNYIVETVYEGKRPTPCREYEGKRVYNKDYFTYDGAEIGDLVEEDIVMDMIDCVPPACMRSDCMQCGEPSSHKIDENGNGRTTYTTFKKYADGIYEYCGECFRGENVERGTEIPYVV